MRKDFCEERKLSATAVTARIEPRQKRSYKKKSSLYLLSCNKSRPTRSETRVAFGRERAKTNVRAWFLLFEKKAKTSKNAVFAFGSLKGSRRHKHRSCKVLTNLCLFACLLLFPKILRFSGALMTWFDSSRLNM